jgi:hypothetical protein
MSSVPESTAEVLQRLYLASDAPLGRAWLQSARITFSVDALHSLVLGSKIPSTSKARSTYGHLRTASQMYKVPGTYWKPDQELAAFLQAEPLRLNPEPTHDAMTRLDFLQKEAIGGILLVTRQHTHTGSFSDPYITIMAAPSLATLGPFSADDPGPPGLYYSDCWEDTVLSGYGVPLPAGPHCPLMASSEGFTRAIKLPGAVELFTESQPLLFLLGEHLVEQVPVPTGSIYRAFFLPEACGLPLGLAWPTTISFADFCASISCLKGGYSNFIPVLKALQPTLSRWLAAVRADPAKFMSPNVPFLDIHDSGYPDLETGAPPDTIIDGRAFSPLFEMAHGFLWRLTCDSVLSTGTAEAQQHLKTFLSRGETAITASSYFGAAIPGRFCPNFAYHFTVVARWPTRIDPLADLAKLSMVSERAQEYEPMVIDLHIPTHPPLTLITKDRQLSENHRRSTPRFSYPTVPSPHRAPGRTAMLQQPGDPAPVLVPAPAPVTEPVPAPVPRQYPPFGQSIGGAQYPGIQPITQPPGGVLPPGPTPIPALGHQAAGHSQAYPSGGPPQSYPAFGQPTLPAPAELYSPPPRRQPGQQPGTHQLPPRSLQGAFAGAIPAAAPAKRSDPSTATILTAQGRQEATPDFLNCCRLLAHHDSTMVLTDSRTGQPLPEHAAIFPRQPTEHFRRDVLGPLFTAPSSQHYLASFYNYVEALLSRGGIIIESAYSKHFFSADRARSLFAIESWATSPQTRELVKLPPHTLHVYSFLQCLLDYQDHPSLLPWAGISLRQAKNLGDLVVLLFRMADMKPDFITSPFDSSIMGQRLLQWSKLADSSAIHHLWEQHQRLLTFLWFDTLREILHIVHCWVKAQRFHCSQGFQSATDAATGSQRLLVTGSFPSHIPGQTTTLVEAFARYDSQFVARWYQQAYTPYDPTWQAEPPRDQFVPDPGATVALAREAGPRDAGAKRVKLKDSRKAQQGADFISTSHLLEAVVPMAKEKAAITTIIARLPRGQRFPLVKDSTGTLQYICFHSAFPPPHNRCITGKCKNHKVSPPVSRVHVDLSIEPWQSKPESFWEPVVAFLKEASVAVHFRPSAPLMALTPSTAWS